MFTTLIRTNGSLGPLSANFSVKPVLAQSGADYVYNAVDPLYWVGWYYIGPSRMHSDGLFGTSGFVQDGFGHYDAVSVPNLSDVIITLLSDPAVAGNLSANFQLANPSQADQFYLGGQDIPLGGALGPSFSPFTLIDDAKTPGVFGFAHPLLSPPIPAPPSVCVRSNGVSGNVTLYYSTSNGTAVAGSDYTPVINPKVLTFGPGVVSNGFNISVFDNGTVYTNFAEKTVNLKLSGLVFPGATFGISNAVLRLINPNYKGYLSLGATNYIGNETAGFITFAVNRASGSQNASSVQYATTNGTAFNGVDYIGATNTLTWASGDVSSRIVSIPLINTLTVGANKYFSVLLRNPTNNGVADPSLFWAGQSPMPRLRSAIITATARFNSARPATLLMKMAAMPPSPSSAPAATRVRSPSTLPTGPARLPMVPPAALIMLPPTGC